MSELKLSIIPVSYNQEQYLEEMILPVLNLRYRNLEYIIDGGITEYSVDLIRKNEDHLAYCVNDPDRGQVPATNNGLARIPGTMFVFINDVYMPCAFSGATNEFDRDAGCAAHGQPSRYY